MRTVNYEKIGEAQAEANKIIARAVKNEVVLSWQEAYDFCKLLTETGLYDSDKKLLEDVLEGKTHLYPAGKDPIRMTVHVPMFSPLAKKLDRASAVYSAMRAKEVKALGMNRALRAHRGHKSIW